MKILFLTEGGRQKGLGHIARCCALSEAILDQDKGVEICFICEADSFVKSLINNAIVDVVLGEWQKDTGKILERVSDFDLIVVDSYTADQGLYECLSEAVSGKILMIDDNNRIKYPRGMVLNPSIYGPGIDYPMEDGTQYLLGKDYILLRKDFWNIPEKHINEDVKNIMVMMGGSNQSTIVETIANTIESRLGIKVNKIDASEKVISASGLIECAMTSDICISGAGQTLYELLRIGIPTIAVELAENQKLNITSLVELGFISQAGSPSDKNFGTNISRIIKDISDKSKRNEISLLGRKMVDGKGALRTAQIILGKGQGVKHKDILKTRTVEQEDCYDVWAWRNNPAVRKWSFSTDSIDYLLHKKWFNEKVKDGSASIFVCEDEDLNKIGQARFELEEGGVYININLNPVFIGRGLGQRVIDMATREFFKKNGKVDMIRAKIKNNNIASKKAFERAGYVCEKYLKDYFVYVTKDDR